MSKMARGLEDNTGQVGRCRLGTVGFARLSLPILLGALMVASAGTGYWINSAKLRTFASTWGWDLAYFNQSCWLAAGGGGRLTINPRGHNIYGLRGAEGPQVWRSVHFQPVRLLGVPCYWLWGGPQCLILMQCIIIALAALPVYGIAKTLSGSAAAGLLLAALYLFDVHWLMVAQSDYRPTAAAVAFYLATAYFLLRGQVGLSIVSAVGVICCREEMILLLLVLCLPPLIHHRRAGLGKRVVLSAIPLAVAVFGWAVQVCYFRLAQGVWLWLPTVGGPPASDFLNRLTQLLATARPWNVLALVAPEYWLSMVFIPWSERLPDLKATALSPWGHNWQYLVPHLTGSVLCVTVGAARVWGWLRPRRRWWLAALVVLLACLVCYRAASFVRLAGRLHDQVASRQSQFRQTLWSLSRRLPAEASVMGPPHMLAPFSSRPRVMSYIWLPIDSPAATMRSRRQLVQQLASELRRTDVLIVKQEHGHVVALADRMGLRQVAAGDGLVLMASAAWTTRLADWLAAFDSQMPD